MDTPVTNNGLLFIFLNTIVSYPVLTTFLLLVYFFTKQMYKLSGETRNNLADILWLASVVCYILLLVVRLFVVSDIGTVALGAFALPVICFLGRWRGNCLKEIKNTAPLANPTGHSAFRHW